MSISAQSLIYHCMMLIAYLLLLYFSEANGYSSELSSALERSRHQRLDCGHFSSRAGERA